MRLATLRALDVPAMWARLSTDQQAAIGTAVLGQQLAQLVAEDDGTDAQAEDRRVASEMADEATDGLSSAVEAAFPSIAWWTP